MKILKIFGAVVGIHLAILIGVFVVPGCTSSTKPAPAPADTVAQADAAPTITVPAMTTPVADTGAGAPAPAFNPDAPATYAGSAGGGVRFTPTRPNTPAASAVLTQPVADVTPAATYAVKSGDSLWTIAKKHHLPVAELAAANNLKTSAVLHQGQKLIIPSKGGGSAAASAATSAPATETKTKAAEPAATPRAGEKQQVTYVVKNGESLSVIAKMFDVRARDIAVANNITDPRNLRAGTKLVIPGGDWQAPKSSRSSASTSKSSSSTPPSSVAPAAAPTIPPTIAEPEPTPAAPASNVPVIKIDDTPPASNAKP